MPPVPCWGPVEKCPSPARTAALGDAASLGPQAAVLLCSWVLAPEDRWGAGPCWLHLSPDKSARRGRKGCREGTHQL